jgi:hypothetical protein
MDKNTAETRQDTYISKTRESPIHIEAGCATCLITAAKVDMYAIMNSFQGIETFMIGLAMARTCAFKRPLQLRLIVDPN